MRYSVDWLPDARNQLAAIWVEQVLERQAITVAQAEIDRRLALDPLANGTALSEGLFAIVVQPLRVVYEVYEKSSIVNVVSSRWFP